jgi:hypothetical protein
VFHATTSTIDALKYELRCFGIAQLKKPRTQARIAELSAEQMGDVIAALKRMQPACPLISDEFVQLLQRVSK